jgi:hypothetical protein
MKIAFDYLLHNKLEYRYLYSTFPRYIFLGCCAAMGYISDRKDPEKMRYFRCKGCFLAPFYEVKK